jgi:hypothetical protein
MMMTKQVLAFTLLELLVYTTLVSLFALGVGGFCSTIYSSLIALGRPACVSLETATVLDVIARDLMSADSNPSSWDTKNFVVTCEHLDGAYAPVRMHIGWETTVLANGKSGVRRSEGVYNFHTHRWTKRGTSILGCAINTLRLDVVLSRDQRMIKRARIRYETHDGQTCSHHIVKLRSRVLV